MQVREELKLHKHLNIDNVRKELLQCDQDGSGIVDKGMFLAALESTCVPTNALLVNKVRGTAASY